jgi:hypothetical protein
MTSKGGVEGQENVVSLLLRNSVEAGRRPDLGLSDIRF